ncbi:MAG: indole-3-glycerol phosphate synthase TrpC [Anaerolineae bacterium]|nr:indole-3-glycerol phosphate synthase TrpC [Anaerolineae bacterium]
MILEKILAANRLRLEKRKNLLPIEALRRRVESLPPTADFAQALRQPGVSLIAEIKRASPSRGALRLKLDPRQLALTYAQAGADAISVLTEERFFFGHPDDLILAQAALHQKGLRCPLLRKDFIIDPYQLLESRIWGADAVLLIVAALDDFSLKQLYNQALDLGLTPLVEVHNERELERALQLQPLVIGINNRDLRTFAVDLSTTARLRPLIPKECLVVAESGIREPEQMRFLADLQVDAALVGEALVTAPDPAAKIRSLKEAKQ